MVSNSREPEIIFRGLDEKTKGEFRATLRHNPLIKRLVEILDLWIEEEAPKKIDYDSPSWAFKQADKNGAIRALTKVKTILDQKDNNV